jgi:hypothetical protein
MAEPFQIEEILAHLNGLYGGRFNPDAAKRKAWIEVLGPFTNDELWNATRATLADPKCFEWAPTPMQIAANVPKRVGATVGGKVGGCPDCAALDGWREMAIRFALPDGRQDARVVLAACGCALGETRRVAGVLPWREQWARWQGIKARLLADGGEIIGAVYTSERRPLLTDEDRYAPDVLGRLERKPRAAAVALLTEAVRGQDSHAWARERQVERDRERDERGWEEAS